MARKVLAAILFGFMGALLLAGSLTLSNVWDDYADSPDSTYVESAAIWLGLALVAAVAGALALRK